MKMSEDESREPSRFNEGLAFINGIINVAQNSRCMMGIINE